MIVKNLQIKNLEKTLLLPSKTIKSSPNTICIELIKKIITIYEK